MEPAERVVALGLKRELSRTSPTIFGAAKSFVRPIELKAALEIVARGTGLSEKRVRTFIARWRLLYGVSTDDRSLIDTLKHVE